MTTMTFSIKDGKMWLDIKTWTSEETEIVFKSLANELEAFYVHKYSFITNITHHTENNGKISVINVFFDNGTKHEYKKTLKH